MEEPKSTAPAGGVSDEDLNLGHILHTADAAHLGAHHLVDSLLTPKPKLLGRARHNPMPLQGAANVAGGGSSALDANDSGGLNPGAVTGRPSQGGTPTDTGVGSRQTNSAGAESDSANERKQ